MTSEHDNNAPHQSSVEGTGTEQASEEATIDGVAPAQMPPKPLQRPAVRWSLAALVLIALGVFFWLPEIVDKPQLKSDDILSAPQGGGGRHIESKPWLEAQLARQRKAAQEVLAKLLDLQFSLEEKAVRQWAPEDFSAVEQIAGEGDQSYRSKQFEEATQHYQNGLDKLRQLETQSESVLSRLINEGQSFFEQRDAALAVEKFTLALAIAPDNVLAETGLRRAKVLDRVLALQAEASKEFKNGNFNRALAVINTALALDTENSQSKADHTIYTRAIIDQQFNAAMSRGYEALLKKQYSNAESAFKQASTLKPGSTEASTALRETVDKRSLAKINSLQQQASQKENDELWGDAKALYEAALAIDSNLIFARVGAIRTQARETLNSKIEALLKQPQRLGNNAVYGEAEVVLRDARAINQPSPILRKQITLLETSLKIAAQTLAVHLKSDNQTSIRINRIGPLGIFYSQQIELKPGSYVAIGSRAGYRDVRQKFTVSSTVPSGPVTIQCTEPI